MKERLWPDLDQLANPDDLADPQSALAWLAGTYESAWPQLKHATFSAVGAATYVAGRFLAAAERVRSKTTDIGEASFVVDMNYSTAVLGPCLGAVQLSAFAVESFVRLGYAVALELRPPRTRSQRAAGLSTLIESSLDNFDDLNAGDRLRTLRQTVGFRFDRNVERQVGALIEYRNVIAHDTPALWTAQGEVRATQRRHRQARPAPSPYEHLTHSNRPVRLKHVLAAVRAHDNLVDLAVHTATLPHWAEHLQPLGGPWLRIADHLPGTHTWPTTKRLAAAWETGIQRDLNASTKELLAFRERFVRRVSIRLEK